MSTCQRCSCLFNLPGFQREQPEHDEGDLLSSRPPPEPSAAAAAAVPQVASARSVPRTRGESTEAKVSPRQEGSFNSGSTKAPTTSNPGSFHSAATTAVPPFIFLIACEVGKLMDFLLTENEQDEQTRIISEERIPIFPGELWRWAEEAAVSYWEKHGDMNASVLESSTDGLESRCSLGLGHEPPTIKEAKEHYQNIILFEYNIDGYNDPSWPEDAWENPKVIAFVDSLHKPVLTPAVNPYADDRGPCSSSDPFPSESVKATLVRSLSGADRAVLLGRIQHVFALAVTVHHLRQDENLTRVSQLLPAGEGLDRLTSQVLDIDQLITDSRAEMKSRRYVQNFLETPQSLLDMQRQQWLTTAQNLNTQFMIYPQLSRTETKDPSADEIPGICEFIMDILSTHLTEMALEEDTKEIMFDKIQARFGDEFFQEPKKTTQRENVLRTFPSRILWEFARDIGRMYCQVHQARLPTTPQHQAFILQLLQNHEDIMFELEDLIFAPKNFPALRYFYFYVLDQTVTAQCADPGVLQDYLVGNSDLSRVIAIGVAFEILRRSGDANMEMKTRPGGGMRGVDMEHVLFCQTVSDKPIDVKNC